jgi:hypothetical protein
MTAPAPISKRPTLVFGTSPGRLGGVGRGISIARETSLLALDLDLRTSWAIPRAQTLQLAAQNQTIRIRSVWLPSAMFGAFTQRRTEMLAGLLGAAKQDFGLRSLVLPRHRDMAERHTTIHNLAREIAARKTGSDVRLVIGLQASDFRHDRWHLDQLAGIRRMAEEWDLDLALDLTGNVSLAWEAEAAVMRVLPRLTMVRLGQWRREDGTLVSNQTGQIAERTVAMLADQGYAGVISLCPETRSQTGASLVIAYQQRDISNRYQSGHLGVPSAIDTRVNDFTIRD